jgi:Bacterial SH3 domain
VEFKSFLGGIGKEGNMAHIIYDNDHRDHYDSAGYNRSRFNGSYALIAIVILFVLFFWADLGWLRGNLDSWLRGNRNSTVQSRNSTVQRVEGSRITSIAEIRHVTVDNLNLREQPGNDAQASYTLPRGTQVALLGESHHRLNGDVWLKVRVETFEGPYVGWVSQRYVE